MYIVFVLLRQQILVWALFSLIKCLVFVCNDEIIRCYFVLFFSFFVAFFVLVIAEELVRRKKRFLKYINLSACIKIEGLEEEDYFFFDWLALQKEW